MPKITKDLDVLIFVGGGLIKFKQQNFHYIITDIIKVAQDLKIPVVFNSVGVEGYDLQDVNCQMLKHAINSKCVKAISTRDDFDLLKNSYIENNKIKLLAIRPCTAKNVIILKSKKQVILSESV